MLHVELYAISDGPPPVVFLKYEGRVLPIVINSPEATAIKWGIIGHKIGRPMTHDLICNLLAGLGGDLQSVSIYKLEDDTFFAHLNIEQRSPEGDVIQVLRVDSRPSDSMAIAVRIGCPIYVAEEVFSVAGQDAAALGIGESDPLEDSDDDDDVEDEFE